MKKEKIEKLKYKSFKRFLGVNKEVFVLMCVAVEAAYKKNIKKEADIAN